MEKYTLKDAIDGAFEYASEINKYIDDETPWKLDINTEEERKKLQQVLFVLLTHLRKVALMLMPFFEVKMQELLERIGAPLSAASLTEELQNKKSVFTIREKGEPLYMRINV